ncbi:hypothetical protein BDZ91DRAFT_761385 [Kalaharituber pfeilii]|nr:hypothetical protein BDZ91DRAFT_761385 [Kalaharituber pfeilii]
MGDSNTAQESRKRKMEWVTSYSNMTMDEAQSRLGFRLRSLEEVPVDEMLAEMLADAGKMDSEAALNLDVVKEEILADPGKTDSEAALNLHVVKEEVYKGILKPFEGSPTEADPDFTESNINHLVYAIVSPILEYFTHKTKRRGVQLRSKKEIVSQENQTGGAEESVTIVDLIELESENFMLIVEAKRSSLGQAFKQCVLAMKDMHGINGSGEVYGFVTTGKIWQMLKYDGDSFQLSEEMLVLFSRVRRVKI